MTNFLKLHKALINQQAKDKEPDRKMVEDMNKQFSEQEIPMANQ